MLASMIFFKGSRGIIRPLFFLSGILFFILPMLCRYGGAQAPAVLLICGLVLMIAFGVKSKSFDVPLVPDDAPARRRASTINPISARALAPELKQTLLKTMDAPEADYVAD